MIFLEKEMNLFQACKEGNLEVVKKLLKDPNMNPSDKNNETRLAS